MSFNITFITKEYYNKQKMLETIESLAQKRGFRIEKEELGFNDDADLDLYIDDPKDEENNLYYCSLEVLSREEYYEHTCFPINDDDYYIYIYNRIYSPIA